MQGRIILNLAVSLDGYIADVDGGYDWITGHGDHVLDTEEPYDFSKFLKNIDVVVMGSKCYEQGMAGDFKSKEILVASSREHKPEEQIRFINGSVTEIVQKERDQGKNIYLFGGGILVDGFLKEDVIDEYIIGIIPVILGAGRPLFLGNNPVLPLHLDRYQISEGIPVLYYSRRKVEKSEK